VPVLPLQAPTTHSMLIEASWAASGIAAKSCGWHFVYLYAECSQRQQQVYHQGLQLLLLLLLLLLLPVLASSLIFGISSHPYELGDQEGLVAVGSTV